GRLCFDFAHSLIQIRAACIHRQLHARQSGADFRNERGKAATHMFEARGSRVPDRIPKSSFRDSDRYRRTSGLEPGKSDLQHRFETAAFLREARGLVDTAFEFHRSAGVSAQPQSFPFSENVDARYSAFYQI